MLPRLWAGVGLAVGVALVAGAVLTFAAYALTFQVQEIIGGTLSLAAVAMVTWMVLWMQRTAKNLKASLEGEVDRALAVGGLWTIVFLGFLSAGREGNETTLLLWSMVQSFGAAPSVLLGAIVGILTAVAIGWLLARGLLRLDLRLFFAWTGAILVIAASGVLPYAFKDLQEAGVVPGPFTAGAPIDPTTGAVAIGRATPADPGNTPDETVGQEGDGWDRDHRCEDVGRIVHAQIHPRPRGHQNDQDRH